MAIVANGRTSLFSFFLGSCILLIRILAFANHQLTHFISDYKLPIFILYTALTISIVLVRFRGAAFQVAIRGLLLGLVFGLSWWLILSDATARLFGWYLGVLSFFHWSEYFSTALSNPRNLSLESYLLDHSREYHMAAFASCAEFFLEFWLWPGMKHPGWISYFGLILVTGGEVLRKLAMVTASSNFNHYVRHVREEGHVLITHGIYGFSRHPAYVGWFYWSIGSQIMLCNPLCAVAYTIVSWKFFNFRIVDEEITLLNFFGEEYLDYQKRVGTGLPFIKGYRAEL
ncbi:hypothetical protein CAPTEDRAFT_223498 [Capitella teleta]|uniref:Protein-S-isoprenylcysteine O-methyltransferase n=1 Tax=Capitella teleta TaxID=283909 RepID=R7VBR5_CAPTE|nr:hypothetical protein CAPTEDRAFT_223498 [Capitella teleta]|eukprot:ELU16074.1 hypothetical protein CAPTEDRAFT_223498 [Capitella teleta]